eukprot:snap_masked-scaffold_7-processed-gene-9.41-mRNA-1 protein AED:1.00 eAED:1.00 QI:0/-1/0/0/-1/1/1/0/304
MQTAFVIGLSKGVDTQVITGLGVLLYKKLSISCIRKRFETSNGELDGFEREVSDFMVSVALEQPWIKVILLENLSTDHMHFLSYQSKRRFIFVSDPNAENAGSPHIVEIRATDDETKILTELANVPWLRKLFVKNNYFSNEFVTSCGSVLFNLSQKRIVIVENRKKDGSVEFVLPKGRKNVGEDVQDAALRETFEETGYPCELFPLLMETRATETTDLEDLVREKKNISEPFCICTRTNIKSGMKLIFWYISKVTGKYVSNTQMQNEDLSPVELPYMEAIEKLSFQDEKNMVEKAIKLVSKTIS